MQFASTWTPTARAALVRPLFPSMWMGTTADDLEPEATTAHMCSLRPVPALNRGHHRAHAWFAPRGFAVRHASGSVEALGAQYGGREACQAVLSRQSSAAVVLLAAVVLAHP